MATKNHKTAKPAPKRSGSVFDVRRPGKAPASATSRPVIVTHKPMAQQAQVAVSGIGEGSAMLASRKITIKPPETPAGTDQPTKDFDPSETPILSPSKTIQPPTETSVAPPSPAPATSDSDPTPSEDQAPKPEAPAETSALPAKTETPEPSDQLPAQTDSLAPAPALSSTPTATPPPRPDPLLAETPTGNFPTVDHVTHKIDPLFDDHGLVVSRHGSKTSAGKVIATVVLILLLAAITLDVLLDMDILTLDTVPHTNFL